MASSTGAPLWLIPVIVVAFPVVFVGFWSFVCWLLATVSGYRSLGRFEIDRNLARQGETLPIAYYAMIGVSSYRGGILTLRATPAGLTVHVARIFPFHPPVRLPWDRVHDDPSGGLLNRLTGGAFLLDGRVRLRLPGAVHAAVVAARAKYYGG